MARTQGGRDQLDRAFGIATGRLELFHRDADVGQVGVGRRDLDAVVAEGAPSDRKGLEETLFGLVVALKGAEGKADVVVGDGNLRVLGAVGGREDGDGLAVGLERLLVLATLLEEAGVVVGDGAEKGVVRWQGVGENRDGALEQWFAFGEAGEITVEFGHVRECDAGRTVIVHEGFLQNGEGALLVGFGLFGLAHREVHDGDVVEEDPGVGGILALDADLDVDRFLVEIGGLGVLAARADETGEVVQVTDDGCVVGFREPAAHGKRLAQDLLGAVEIGEEAQQAAEGTLDIDLVRRAHGAFAGQFLERHLVVADHLTAAADALAGVTYLLERALVGLVGRRAQVVLDDEHLGEDRERRFVLAGVGVEHPQVEHRAGVAQVAFAVDLAGKAGDLFRQRNGVLVFARLPELMKLGQFRGELGDAGIGRLGRSGLRGGLGALLRCRLGGLLGIGRRAGKGGKEHDGGQAHD